MADPWNLLDEKELILVPSQEVGAWNLLDEKEIILVPSQEVGAWNLLDEKEITLIPSEEVGAWNLLDQKEVTLDLKSPPSDGVVEGVPWKWVLIGIGSVVGVGTIVALARRKPEGKK